MGREARARIGLKHAIAQGKLRRQSPQRSSFGSWQIRVWLVGHWIGRIFLEAEAIHLAMVPVPPPGAMAMVKVELLLERDRLKLDLLALVHAGSGGVCAWKTGENIIEGSVFLHDYDYVTYVGRRRVIADVAAACDQDAKQGQGFKSEQSYAQLPHFNTLLRVGSGI
jgi:hypothetical protein